MSQKPVVTVEGITNIALEERRPGCEKGVLHEDGPVLTAVYRVQPGKRRSDAPACTGLRSFCRPEGKCRNPL
jgi:hypothetical protein